VTYFISLWTRMDPFRAAIPVGLLDPVGEVVGNDFGDFYFNSGALIDFFAKVLNKDEKVSKVDLIAAVEIIGCIGRTKELDKGKKV